MRERRGRLQKDPRYHILLFVEQEEVTSLFQDWRMASVAPSGCARLEFDRDLLERKSINDEEVQELPAHFRRAAQLEETPRGTPVPSSGTSPSP